MERKAAWKVRIKRMTYVFSGIIINMNLENISMQIIRKELVLEDL